MQDWRSIGSFIRKKLSGGLLRRLNIACGIAHKPQLIFMDEPTVAVDPQSRNKILEGILQLAQEGATIVYTTHYMEEAERICSRIIDYGSRKSGISESGDPDAQPGQPGKQFCYYRADGGPGAVMSILSWGILTVMGMVIFREQLGKVPEKTLLLLALAGFCLMLVCIAVAEILAILIKKAEIIDMAANFVTLGICFLSGIFVPLELLGEGVKKAAQVTPTYWYAKAVDDIFGLTSFTGEKLRPVFMSLGILLAFAAALLAWRS